MSKRLRVIIITGVLLVLGAVFVVLILALFLSSRQQAKVPPSVSFLPPEEPCEPPVESSDGYKLSDPCRIISNPDGGSVISNEIIVVLERGVSEEALEPILEAVEGQVVGHVTFTNEYKIEIPTTTFEELDAALRIARDLNVEGVELITRNAVQMPL